MTAAAPHTLGAFLERYPEVHPGLSETAEAVDYRRLSIDSRTLENGALFVALHGENHDGHRFVEAALKKGAAAAVVEKRWIVDAGDGQTTDPERLVVVNDTLHFLQELAAWHRRRFDVPVIGLTGSNGKTTTRAMIGAVLARGYRVHQTRGNFNNHIGLPLTLLAMDETVEIAVVEMGMNHPGEIARLTEIAAPTAGLVTNIARAHIEFFDNLDGIYAEKTALFRGLPGDAPIFLNVDDPHLVRYPRDERVVTVGSAPDAAVRGAWLRGDGWGRPVFRLNDGIEIALAVPGRHNVSNALLAAAVGLHFGISPEDVAAALGDFRPEGQRMAVSERDGVRIVNDAYNANPDSMRAAVDFLAGLDVAGRRYLALGDMLELGHRAEAEHRELGRYIAGMPVERVFLYGPNGARVREGMAEGGAGEKAECCTTHADIAIALAGLLNAGDVLLVKGSRGMTMERVLEALASRDAADGTE